MQTGKKAACRLVYDSAPHSYSHYARFMELTVFDLLTMPVYHPTIEKPLHTALLDLANARGRPRQEIAWR
jgi:hypothetical protein